MFVVFFFQAEDGIRDVAVTGVQTCALPILGPDQTADRDRPRRAEGGRPGGPGAVEGTAPRGRRPPPARRRPGRRDARALLHLDARPPQPRARPREPAPGAGAARSGLPARRPAPRGLHFGALPKISASSAGGVTSSWS